MKFKILLTAIIILMFATLLYYSSKKESKFRIPIAQFPISYDLSVSADYYTALVLRNIHDVLIDFYRGDYVNILCDYWFTPDDHTLTLKLKDKQYFSDGTLVTIEDVKNSYEWMLTQPHSPFVTMTFIDSMFIRPDNYLDIYTSLPISELNIFVRRVGIFKSDELKKGSDHLNNNPLISTGPYYLYSKDDHKIVLRKNKYHRDYIKNKKAPDVVELYLQPDLYQHYQMMRENKVDFIQFLPVDMYPEVLQEQRYNVIENESENVMYMMLNATSDTISNANSHTSQNETTQSTRIPNPLLDKKVRLAIAHSLDINTFIERTVLSKAYALALPATRNLEHYPTDKTPYEYDLPKARALMSEAGFSDGFQMTIRSLEGKFTRHIQTYFQNRLKYINIDVTIDFRTSQDFYADLNIDTPAAYINSLGVPNSRNLFNVLRALYYRSPTTQNLFNRFLNYDQNINNLLDDLMEISEYDDKYSVVLNELIEAVIDEVFVIPIMNPHDIYVLNKKFSYKETHPYLKFTDFVK